MRSFREAREDDAEVLTRLIRSASADVAERFGLTAEVCPSHPAFTTVDQQRHRLSGADADADVMKIRFQADADLNQVILYRRSHPDLVRKYRRYCDVNG